MKNIQCLILAGLLTSVSVSTMAQDNWFVRPYAGLSQMSDVSGDFTNIDGLSSGNADIDLDTGFNAGIGVGYLYNDNFAVELGWEFRSNDSETVLNNASTTYGGDFASSIFYLNGHYLLSKKGKWQPYVGAGLTFAQEVDIDLEVGGNELSYSGDGDIGYQVFTGVNYDLNEKWKLQGEARYGSMTDLDLKAENDAAGQFNGLDYKTTTLQLGVVYSF